MNYPGAPKRCTDYWIPVLECTWSTTTKCSDFIISINGKSYTGERRKFHQFNQSQTTSLCGEKGKKREENRVKSAARRTEQNGGKHEKQNYKRKTEGWLQR